MTEQERLKIETDKMELLLRACSLQTLTGELNQQQKDTLAKLIDKLSEQLKL